MIRINLLPVRVSKKKEAGKNQLILFALLVVAVLIGNYWWNASRAADLAAAEAKVKRTRAEIGQLEKIIGEVKNIKEQQAAVKDKLAVLDRLKAGRQGPVKMLEELSSLTPKRLWLKKLDEKGGAIAFDGSAATLDDVSAFLSGLKKSPFFSEVELKKTSAKREGKLQMLDFLVTAKVNYTPGVQVVAATPSAAEKR